MLKFLRKYNKYILVVGGALLMVAFLMPQSMQQCAGDPRSAPAFRLQGDTVTVGEVQKGFAELAALERLAPVLPTALGIDESGTQWLLATTLAQKAGLVGGPEDGRGFLDEIAPTMAAASVQAENPQLYQFAMQYPPLRAQLEKQVRERTDQFRQALDANVRRVAAQGGMTETELLEALARARGLERLLLAYQNAPRLSEPRAIAEARRLLDAATISYVLVPADALLAEVPEPDEAAIAAHFQAYKDVLPGTGELGIGYRNPRRIQLEWLKLDRAAIGAAVRADPVEVSRRLRQNPPAANADRTEARRAVEQALRDEITDKALKLAEQTVRAELIKATRRLPESGSFRVLPEDWDRTRPTLQSIAAIVQSQVKEQLGLDVPLPETVPADGRWLSADELGLVPGVGRAVLRRGDRSIGIGPVVAAAKEFGGDGVTIHIQAGLTFDEALQDATGNRYFVTLVAAEESAPPASVDEVRDRVVLDLRRLRAFDMLTERASTYETMAAGAGLESVVQTLPPSPDGTPPDAETEIRRGVRVSRASQLTAHARIDSPGFRDAIVTRAQSLDPTVPLDQVDPGRLTLALPVRGSLALVVARITAFEPVTTESFRLIMNGDGLLREIQRTEWAATADNPFRLSRLYERLDVRRTEREGGGRMTDEDADSPPEAGSATPAAPPAVPAVPAN